MGVFAKLFGSEKIIDAGISGIDKAFYTAEEKSEDDLKRIALKMQFMKLYEPFKIAQRYLALMTGIPFVSLHVIVAVNWILAVWLVADKVRYEFVTDQLHIIAEMNNTTLGEPFAIILFFYFLGGAGEGIVNKLMGKKK